MPILILGSSEDDHAATMLAHLRGRGADAELLDSKLFPGQMQIAFDPRACTGTLRFPHRTMALDTISAVYWRCYNGIVLPNLPDPEQAFIAKNDSRSLFESLLIHLPTRWVNGWQAYQMHQTKPVQLAAVAALGIPVPETLLSNDPGAIVAFAQRCPNAIFKPIQGGAHTQRVTPRHLTPENLANLTVAPVTLQEEIVGTDIRVFVAGTRVLACQVSTPHLDFREDPNPVIQAVTLPTAIETQCLQIARTLHLLWTGIDLRRTPDGRYIFLEANPSPMFLGFERLSGLPLTAALTDLLLAR